MKLKNKIKELWENSFFSYGWSANRKILFSYLSVMLTISFFCFIALCITIQILAKREAFSLFATQHIIGTHMLEEDVDVDDISNGFYSSIPSPFEQLAIRPSSKNTAVVIFGDNKQIHESDKSNFIDRLIERMIIFIARPKNAFLTGHSRINGEKLYVDLFKNDCKLEAGLRSTLQITNNGEDETFEIISTVDVGKAITKEIKYILICLIVVYILFAAIIYKSYYNGYKFFVKPIRKINQDFVAITEGKQDEIELCGKEAEEVTILSDKINALIQKARELNSSSKTFIEETAHEIKNPLNNIINMAELQKDVDETCSDTMDVVIQQAYTINSLLDGLQDISQIFLLKNDVHLFSMDMCPVEALEEVLEYYKKTYPEQEFVLEVMEGFHLRLWMKPKLFNLVIQNIVGNAIKFADKDTPIIIRLSEDGCCGIKIAIINKGPRIPLKEYDKIFHKYYRAKDTEGKVGGSGLGLWIVKEILTIHKSNIFARSTDDSTIFVLEFSNIKK